eukprot:1027414-Amphidinium_carterae.1
MLWLCEARPKKRGVWAIRTVAVQVRDGAGPATQAAEASPLPEANKCTVLIEFMKPAERAYQKEPKWIKVFWLKWPYRFERPCATYIGKPRMQARRVELFRAWWVALRT